MILLKDVGEPVGSRRWGGWCSTSDYDRIVYIDEYEEMIAYHDIQPSRDHKYGYAQHLLNDFHVYVTDPATGFSYNFLVYRSKAKLNVAMECATQIDIISRTTLGLTMSDRKAFRYNIVEKVFQNTWRIFREQTSGLNSMYSPINYEITPSEVPVPERVEVRGYDTPVAPTFHMGGITTARFGEALRATGGWANIANEEDPVEWGNLEDAEGQDEVVPEDDGPADAGQPFQF